MILLIKDVYGKNKKESAFSKCRNAQEEEAVKKVTKKNLLAWGLLQMQEGKFVPTNGYMLLMNNSMPDRYMKHIRLYSGISEWVQSLAVYYAEISMNFRLTVFVS